MNRLFPNVHNLRVTIIVDNAKTHCSSFPPVAGTRRRRQQRNNRAAFVEAEPSTFHSRRPLACRWDSASQESRSDMLKTPPRRVDDSDSSESSSYLEDAKLSPLVAAHHSINPSRRCIQKSASWPSDEHMRNERKEYNSSIASSTTTIAMTTMKDTLFVVACQQRLKTNARRINSLTCLTDKNEKPSQLLFAESFSSASSSSCSSSSAASENWWRCTKTLSQRKEHANEVLQSVFHALQLEDFNGHNQQTADSDSANSSCTDRSSLEPRPPRKNIGALSA